MACFTKLRHSFMCISFNSWNYRATQVFFVFFERVPTVSMVCFDGVEYLKTTTSMGHDTALFCDFCWCISCTTTFIIWKWSQLFHRMWLRLCYLFPVVAEAPWVFVFEPPFQLLQNGTFELNPGQPVKCASIHPSRLWPGSDLSRLSQRLWPETQTLPHN